MKIKQILSLSIAAVILGTLAVSCNFGLFSGYKKSKNGVYYKIFTDDNKDTTAIRVGSVVTLDIKYGLKDSTLFDSKTTPRPIVIQVPKPQYDGDFYECLTLCKQGDSASFILKAGPLFKTTFQQPECPEFMTDESDVYFYVKINKVQSQEDIDRETEIKNMEMEKAETQLLQDYIQKNNITVQPSATGIYYLETKKGTGKSPAEDMYITAHYAVNLLGGEQLFSTRDKDDPVDFKFNSPFENKGFMEVIGKMREGGKANAIVPSAMAFGAEGAGSVVPPFSTLYYDIELIKVMNKQEYDARQTQKAEKRKADAIKKDKDEEAIIQKYIKDNGITPTASFPNGLIYIEKEAGKGPKAQAGKKVKVHYTGKLLDGTKFDSSVDRGEPFEFTLGKQQVIEGWDLGIALMNEGAKGMLIIPSKLGYKDRGAGGGQIPPYATLIFDVELVEVEK